MGNRFVRPSTTTLQLSDGDTITVKTRLTHGERSDSYARQYQTNDEGKLELIPGQIKLSMVTAYLVDWSLTDEAGERVAIFGEPVETVERIVRNLFPEDFDEILSAIEKHELAQKRARAQEKKLKPAADAAISSSPSVVVGASTGSVS
jgi:hypothetical protein